MKKYLTTLALCLCCALLQAQTADEYIAQGREYLATQDFYNAYQKFVEAIKAAPDNEEANALAAATRLLSLPKQPGAKKFLDELGVSPGGRNPLNWTATMRENASGDVIFPAGYDSTKGVQFFRTNILPLIAQSGANLAKIADTNFSISLSAAETSVQAVTIDYGDIQVMRAFLAAAQCLGYSLTAQNLSVVIPKLQSMAKNDGLTVQSLLATYPSLLQLANPRDLATSKKALTNAISLYFSASEFIRLKRPAGVNCLFNLDAASPVDLEDEATFRTNLTNILASLEGPVIPDSEVDYTLDLRAYFSGAHPLRSFVPKFKGDGYVHNSMPDYTFGGLINGMAPCDIEAFVREHFGQKNFSGVYSMDYWDWETQGYYPRQLALYVGTNHQAVLLGDAGIGSVMALFTIEKDGNWEFSYGNFSGHGRVYEDGGAWGEMSYDGGWDQGYFYRWMEGYKGSSSGAFKSAAGYYAGTMSSTDTPGLFGILATDGQFWAVAADAQGRGKEPLSGNFDQYTREIEALSHWRDAVFRGSINLTTSKISGTFEDPDSLGNWAMSRVGRLVFETAPVLVAEPVDLTVEAGSGATFSTKATGSGPLSYQWYCNGERILGATKSTYTIPHPGLDLNGNIYSVTVRNLAGEASTEATLDVKDTTAPLLQITNLKAGQQLSNHVFNVTGIATDASGVSEVWWQLNDGDWKLGSSTDEWAHWSANLMLMPGTNTLRAFAKDYAQPANFSSTNALQVMYIALTPLDIVVNGSGTVKGATDGQNLPIGRTITLTAAPGTGFGFLNWEITGGEETLTSTNRVFSFLMRAGLTATATFIDVEKPVATLVLPTAYQKWSNDVFTVKGTARDNRPGGTVFVAVNDGGLITAAGWSNWTAVVGLLAGTNRIAAYGVDSAGNVSATVQRALIYIPCADLKTKISGNGTISPNYDGKLLPINKSFSMTANPRSGSVFSNWVDEAGAVVTNSPTVKFVVQSNLVFQANFIPNPFLSATGAYSGLFYDSENPITTSNSGYFSAQVTSGGTVSGKLQQGAAKYSYTGKMAVDGTWETSKIPGAPGWHMALKLGLDGENEITGTVGNGVWTADIIANRSVYKLKHPAPQAGQYTMVLPGSDDAENLPGGDGVAAVNVSASGVVSVSGTLGDRTTFSASSIVSEDGYWPLYVPLYGNKGLLMGWMEFVSEPGSQNDVEGPLAWIKPKVSGATMYPNGFTWPYDLSDKQAFGSKFVNKTPVLNWTQGVGILEHGNLMQPFQNAFVMTSSTRASGTNRFSLTITTSGVTAGLFKGSLLHPETRKTNNVSGALLQNRDMGFGSFSGKTQTGRIRLESQ